MYTCEGIILFATISVKFSNIIHIEKIMEMEWTGDDYNAHANVHMLVRICTICYEYAYIYAHSAGKFALVVLTGTLPVVVAT